MPKIMALAMSHRDMQPILEKLGGPAAPTEWQGGLPIDYRLGGEAARVRIYRSDMGPTSSRTTSSKDASRAASRPDEWVVLGNHHDAWVFGGVDPIERHRRR